jgi:hypothetical protein
MDELGDFNDPGRPVVLDLLPFFALLALVWAGLTTWIWFTDIVDVTVYYSLLYVSFLGVVELSSAFDFRLPDRRWLKLTIATGFGAWMLALYAYFLG